MDEVRRKLMEDSHVLLLYKTISGEGFRVIYWYEGEDSNPAEGGIYYRAAYKKGNAYFAELCQPDHEEARLQVGTQLRGLLLSVI